jgi:radical SAM protein with 4Fe4S-binding SPASM domain
MKYLQLETTNHCNAHCTFCPHHQFTEKGFMSDALYWKILTEAQRIPTLEKVVPMLTGEPFLDKQFVYRLKLLRQMLPKVEIEVYTNGSLLTRELVSELKGIPGVKYSVSVNGLKGTTRKRLMGLDDMEKVKAGLRAMEEAGIEYRPTMVYSTQDNQECVAFNEAGGLSIQYQSWAGQQYNYKRTVSTRCERALYEMTVRYNGDVVLCCFDPFGEVTFGNLNRQTIEEVWTSEKHRNYQRLHARGRGQELKLCGQCTEGLTTSTE